MQQSRRVNEFNDGCKIHVQTSDGRVRHGRRAGTFDFTIDGVGHQLVALQLVDSAGDELFVPFRDATNADETYQAAATSTSPRRTTAPTTS